MDLLAEGIQRRAPGPKIPRRQSFHGLKLTFFINGLEWVVNGFLMVLQISDDFCQMEFIMVF